MLSAAEQVQKHHGFAANQVFQPLPQPSGSAPYHLDLADLVPVDQISKAEANGSLVFHCAGDTGGVKMPEPQQIVADWMSADLSSVATPPLFFYHLGDVVYFNGETSEYYPQFYEPYSHYGAPIVAIPGNHDGDPLDPSVEPSLTAFVNTFCSTRPHLAPQAREIQRDTMVQPHVYWTLNAPFVTIVGIYSNVPEGGRLDSEQIAWFNSELAAAPNDKALIVAMHHPAYSADAHHGGSAYMAGILDQAISASGRTPDAVLTGHVHNYQRFTRRLADREVPYIVAGAGGYWHLHSMAKDGQGNRLQPPVQLQGSDATLEAYVDDRHGYLRLALGRDSLTGDYVTVPRPQESWRDGPVAVADTFTLNLRDHTVS